MKEAPGFLARRLSCELLDRVLRFKQPFDESFERAAAKAPYATLDPRDRAFAHALTAAALRRKGDADRAIARYLRKPLPASSGIADAILLCGAAQLLFLGTPSHAAIDLAVEIAKTDPTSRPFAGLVNAVLRRIARLEPEPPGLNAPDWLFARWEKSYGRDTALRIAESHLAEPTLDLSVKSDPWAWADRLGGTALPGGTVRLEAHKGRIEDLAGYAEGAWWVQDAAAAMPVRLLGDVRGKRVLDLCAAPGGKTAQLAAAGAAVTAVDSSASRMARLKENLARLKLAADCILADASTFEAPPFDAVLLDAPCSATGTIRRHPDLPHIKPETAIAGLAALQERLLEHAAALVAPGGRLAYGTCSLEPEEGEERIAAFLVHRPGFARCEEPAPESIPSSFFNEYGDLRTLPCMSIGASKGLDGFFAACLERRS